MLAIEAEADLILEMEDLIEYDKYTHDIKVSKSVFDDFQERKIIYIHFVEDNDDCIREYKMTEEDYEGIYMEYLCEYSDY